jgi:hypothetical protein
MGPQRVMLPPNHSVYLATADAALIHGGLQSTEGRHAIWTQRAQLAVEIGGLGRMISPKGLAIEVDGRLRSGHVIEVLSRLISER